MGEAVAASRFLPFEVWAQARGIERHEDKPVASGKVAAGSLTDLMGGGQMDEAVAAVIG
jgi:hypothetical protein